MTLADELFVFDKQMYTLPITVAFKCAHQRTHTKHFSTTQTEHDTK